MSTARKSGSKPAPCERATAERDNLSGFGDRRQSEEMNCRKSHKNHKRMARFVASSPATVDSRMLPTEIAQTVELVKSPLIVRQYGSVGKCSCETNAFELG